MRVSYPWAEGPPKSEQESWAWTRRSEVLGLAGILMRSRYESADPATWDHQEEAKRAVEASIALHTVVDERMPRQ